MKKVILLATFCMVVLLASNETFAQQNRAGVIIGIASGDFDEIGFGGVAEFKVIEKGTISPQLLFYFPGDDMSLFEINGNFNYYFYNEGVLEFYGLAGLNLTRWHIDYGDSEASDSELGLNLGAGLNFDLGKNVVPFTELRLTLGEFDQVVIGLGLKFNLN